MVWYHFAASPVLRILALSPCVLFKEIAYQMTRDIIRPFAGLISLKYWADCLGICALWLTNLVHLNISLLTNDYSPFTLGFLTRASPFLRSLRVFHTSETRWDGLELLCMPKSCCKALQTIVISGNWFSRAADGHDETKDIHIEIFTRALPSLKDCQLDVLSRLTFACLDTFKQNCPLLERVIVNGYFDPEDPTIHCSLEVEYCFLWSRPHADFTCSVLKEIATREDKKLLMNRSHPAQCCRLDLSKDRGYETRTDCDVSLI